MTYTRMSRGELAARWHLGDEEARMELALRGDEAADRNRLAIIEAERRVDYYVALDTEKWAAAHDDLERLVEERIRMLEGMRA